MSVHQRCIIIKTITVVFIIHLLLLHCRSDMISTNNRYNVSHNYSVINAEKNEHNGERKTSFEAKYNNVSGVNSTYNEEVIGGDGYVEFIQSHPLEKLIPVENDSVNKIHERGKIDDFKQVSIEKMKYIGGEKRKKTFKNQENEKNKNIKKDVKTNNDTDKHTDTQTHSPTDIWLLHTRGQSIVIITTTNI